MRYMIFSPPYRHNSAGVRVLYELQKHLIRAGEDAMVVNEPITLEPDDIVVLPEIYPYPYFVKGNKVVRYYLAEPIEGIDYHADEIKFAFNSFHSHIADGRVLSVPAIESFFHNKGYNDRPLTCFYVGKGKYFKHPLTSDGCVEITYVWPPNRQELAELLNKCSVLYTYDGFTSLANEAHLCGCSVKLLQDGNVTDYDITFYGEFSEQLKTFIEVTKS